MLYVGIDPAPDGFSYAVYNDALNEFLDWGSILISPHPRKLPPPDFRDVDKIGIEDIVSMWQRDKYTIETVKMIGRLSEIYPYAVLIPRKRIATITTGSAKSGDKQINPAIKRLVPMTAKVRKGLNGHHRAAMAVAYALREQVVKGKIESIHKEIVNRERGRNA